MLREQYKAVEAPFDELFVLTDRVSIMGEHRVFPKLQMSPKSPLNSEL